MNYKDINLDKIIVYDIETLINCFVVCCRDFKTGKKKQFVIYDHEDYKNEALDFYKFLRNCVKTGYSFVGFNNLGFDAQVIHEYYEWCSDIQDPLYNFDNKYIIAEMYKKAQELINVQDEKEKWNMLVREADLFAPQIDMYKQLHFDRPAKATSLKWIQFSMRYHTIEEIPIPHDVPIDYTDVESVVEYCWNDVDSTFEFYTRLKAETELRLTLSKEYSRNLINASEPKMAREIFGKYLCEELKIPYSELKTQKTIRKEVKFKEIIFPYVKFITPELQKVLHELQDVVIDCNPHSKQNFAYSFNYNGLKVDLGLGGIHSCISPGVYTPKEGEEILDLDVTSMYPMIAIKNNLKPAHLGDTFSKIYNEIFIERTKYEKKDPRNYILKIILNSAYGLSSEINSYFYDKQFTYGITVNGQLSLLMLVEALYKSVPGLQVLQKNTDGVTFIYDKQYSDMVDKIRKWWEKTTKLALEEAHYSKMVIMDVNNYMAIYTDGKTKKKGLFETEKAYHKNPSSLIVSKALEQFYLNETPIEQFISSDERDIFDFCNGVKKKSNFKLNLVRNYNHAELVEEQQKVCRFIITKQTDNSGLLVKDFADGRRIAAQAGVQVIPLNSIPAEYQKANLYPLDINFYTRATNKIINLIEPEATQQILF